MMMLSQCYDYKNGGQGGGGSREYRKKTCFKVLGLGAGFLAIPGWVITTTTTTMEERKLGGGPSGGGERRGGEERGVHGHIKEAWA